MCKNKNDCTVSINVKNIEAVQQYYLNKEFHQLTVIEVYVKSNSCWCTCKCTCGNTCTFKLTNVKRGRNKSCGCAISKEVMSAKQKKFWKDHPDKSAERSIKYSKWCKENPSKVKSKSDKVSLFYKEHPEVAADNGKKISEWYKNNPDKVKERSNRFSKWCKDNQNIVDEKISTAVKMLHRKNRIASITDEILNIVHPDDREDLIKGDFHTRSKWVRSKCPVCGEYDYHPVSNVISYTKSAIKKLPLCKNCQSEYTSSRPEQDICDYISTFYNGECVKNARDVIYPLELDLYYPEKRIAIEYNGLYWHDDKHKTYDYHLNKFKMCKEIGIRLISVFEQDWMFKNDKVCKLIKDAFSQKQKIYARSCEVVNIDKNIRSEFVNKYHFDGDSYQGIISYGLFYNSELVSVMSFGKLRGQNSLRSNDGYYELVRLVSKDNLYIVGGASKLLKHFIKEYNPKYILCYSDNDFFMGNVYMKLGFTLKSLGEKSIDYQWCNCNEVLSRQQCMPCKLLKKFPQYANTAIDGSKEKYIMEDMGYHRVYRCGNSIWEMFL